MITSLTNFFGGLWAKIAAIGLFLLFVVGAALALFFDTYKKGEAAGTSAVIAKQTEKANEVDKQFQNVDSERPDFDAAVGRLRQRSGAAAPVQRPDPR
jgi:hypothetical protein